MTHSIISAECNNASVAGFSAILMARRANREQPRAQPWEDVPDRIALKLKGRPSTGIIPKENVRRKRATDIAPPHELTRQAPDDARRWTKAFSLV
jgi:hypothetical protein